jgi:DNA-binding NarL/FixJ family response regulator
MTTFDSDEHVLAALDAGASGFVLKTTPPDRLISFVPGASVLSPEAVQRLRRGPPSPIPPRPRGPRRSARVNARS